MIVYSAGVFDILHQGHLNILERSRALAGPHGKLFVGVLTDEGAAAYKPQRPTQDQATRLRIINSLSFVTAGFLQPGTDPSPVLRTLASLGLKPDVMTHGNDWTKLREGNETLEELGIRLELLPYTAGVSTTEIRARIQAA